MNSSTDPFPSLEELGALRTTAAAGGITSADAAMVIDDARRHGYDDGFAAGTRDGLAQGTAAARSDAAFALTALTDAIEDLHRRETIGIHDVATEVVQLALEVAEAVIGRELALAKHPGRDALVRALALAPDRGAARARLHPIDIATLGDTTAATGGRQIDIVADESIERGGCILEVGATRIDAQLGAALDRVKLELANADLVAAANEPDDESRAELTVFEGGRS